MTTPITTLEDSVERYDQTDTDSDLANTDYVEDGVTTTNCGACDGSCPELTDVTIEQNSYTIGEIAAVRMTLTPTMVAQPSAASRVVSLQLLDSDGEDLALSAELKLRLVDDLGDPGTPSAKAPDLPGKTEWTAPTDATGLYEFTIEHGEAREWKLVVILSPFIFSSYDGVNFDIELN